MFAAHFGPRRELPRFNDPEQKGVIFNAILQVTTEGVERGDLSGDPVAIAQAVLGQVLICTVVHLEAETPVELTDASAGQVVDLLLRGAAGTPAAR